MVLLNLTSGVKEMTLPVLNRIFVLVLLFSVTSCGLSHKVVCDSGQYNYVQETLYFGSKMNGGNVTEGDWGDFIDTVVTPRFPDGLTYTAVSGQWRGSGGEIIKEDSYSLMIVHLGSDKEGRAIKEIVDIYKDRYQQEAVLRITNETCVSF